MVAVASSEASLRIMFHIYAVLHGHATRDIRVVQNNISCYATFVSREVNYYGLAMREQYRGCVEARGLKLA